VLLWCATPESVTKLEGTDLPPEEIRDMERYYNQCQAHDSFNEYLELKLKKDKCQDLFAQVVHSLLFKNQISSGFLLLICLLAHSLSSVRAVCKTCYFVMKTTTQTLFQINK